MNENEVLIENVIEGIQDKKGVGIKVVDLRKIEDTICKYLVICQGNSPSQVLAICDSVEDTVRKRMGEKPTSIDGRQNAIWIALDYFDVVVHVFVPDAREFYDVDHLWEDADATEIPDVY